MSHELFYTSAPRGLQPGSRGFATVAVTQGLPAPVLEKLEQLSGYRALFPPHDAQAALNPVAYTHLRLTVGGRTIRVLSRVCAAGLDYTQRANTFAHHVVLDAGELPPGGPAWLASQPGFLEDAWDGQLRVLPAGRTPPWGDAPPQPCRAWHHVTGDAGWAGVLVEAFLADSNRPTYLVFDPGVDPLPLLAEAVALLPPERRWEVTFSTYFTGLPQGVECLWRCVPRGSAEAKGRPPGAVVIPLSRGAGPAPDGVYAEAARAGGPVAPVPMQALPSDEDVPSTLAQQTTTVPVQFQSSQRPADLMRSANAPVTAPLPQRASAPPPGLPQSAWSAPDNRDPRQRTWTAGMLVGLLTSAILSGGVFGTLWYFGIRKPGEVEPPHENTVARLQVEYELREQRLLGDVKKLESSIQSLNEQLKELSKKANEAVGLKSEIKARDNRIAELEKQLKEAAVAAAPKPKDKQAQPQEKQPPGALKPATTVERNVGLPLLTQSGLEPPRYSFNKDLQIPTGRSYIPRLRGLPWKLPEQNAELQEEPDNGGKALTVYHVTTARKTPICTVGVEQDDILFRWVVHSEESKRAAEACHEFVRSLVLELRVTGGSDVFHVALRRPVAKPSLGVEPTTGRLLIAWNPEEGKPRRQLFIGHVQVSVQDKKRAQTADGACPDGSGVFVWPPQSRLRFADWNDLASRKITSKVKKDDKVEEVVHKCAVKATGLWELQGLITRVSDEGRISVDWQRDVIGVKPSPSVEPKIEHDSKAQKQAEQVLKELEKKVVGQVKNNGPVDTKMNLSRGIVYMKLDELHVPVLRWGQVKGSEKGAQRTPGPNRPPDAARITD